MRSYLPLLLATAALTGCSSDSFTFETDDGRALDQQTFAIGTEARLMVWGPPAFDMKTTTADTDSDGAIELGDMSYPEPHCAETSASLSAPGTYPIELLRQGDGNELSSSTIEVAPADSLTLRRSFDDGFAIEPPPSPPTALRVVSGGAARLDVVLVGDGGDELSGAFAPTITGGQAEVLSAEGAILLHGAAPGPVSITGLDERLDFTLDVIPEDAIVAVRVDLRDMDSGGTVQDWTLEDGWSSQEELFGVAAAMTGLTAAGDEVLGLEATWSVDGEQRRVGEHHTLDYGYGGTLTACWQALCASLAQPE